MKVALSISENEHISIERRIGRMGNGNGPTVVFTGGIHGNEPSGVLALHDVTGLLRTNGVELNGNFIALAGNLSALAKGIRFNEEDLNRIWTHSRVEELQAHSLESLKPEMIEQQELFDIISTLLINEEGPFYFIDLHTTSGPTVPFLTINDAMINRKFAEKFNLPVILGIEEYLEGPLLSYINELGYVGVGFEAGQHDDPEAYRNQVAYILEVLEVCGLLNSTDLPSFHELTAPLAELDHDFYEIRYRYAITEGEEFSMKPGFTNFERIATGELLAWSGENEIEAPQKGLIFMPLYQNQGDDGFFVIRRLNGLVLWISKILRRIRFDTVLTMLPGVRRSPSHDGLEVDLGMARFFAKDFFHLLGYRSAKVKTGVLHMTNRERNSRSSDYKNYL
jgi:predicted deacylase